MDLIISDLRQAGYGIDAGSQAPIEVASEFRITMVFDQDQDGIIGDGERVTYFLDPDQNQSMTTRTQNPYDFVLRRVISDDVDPNALPGPAKGNMVAYLVTQRSEYGSPKSIPLFTFRDAADAVLTSGEYDIDEPALGITLTNEQLGISAGSVNQVSSIEVNLVAETPAPLSGSGSSYRRVALSSTISPRSFRFGFAAHFTDNANEYSDPPPEEEEEEGGEGGSGGEGSDEDPELPPYEPPIHISTQSVLAMAAVDLEERDSQEGSFTGTDNQHDVDVLVGTRAGGINNLSVWLNGQPDKYFGGRIFTNAPNYYGSSPFDQQAMIAADLDNSGSPDIVTATRVHDTHGGFQVWLNQDTMNPGFVGSGSGTSSPNHYYTQSSGSGQGIAVADFDGDGDKDVILGTRTGDNQGQYEIWRNKGAGTFEFYDVYSATGEVNAVVAMDFDKDGRMDFIGGTKTDSNDIKGRIDVFHGHDGWFHLKYGYESSGKVNALAVGNLNGDSCPDLVAGTKTGASTGKVEFWKGTGWGFEKADDAPADGVVLSVAVGPLSYPDTDPDVAAGTKSRRVEVWFADPSRGDDLLPDFPSWSDANAGGEVKALEVAKLEVGLTNAGDDLLYDLVVGTSTSPTSGEIVIYLNPYVWTLQP